MNNQNPNTLGIFPNNCRCSGEIRELQRKINNIENRINRLENRVFGNNWNNFGPFNPPTMMGHDSREYTNGNYIL